MGYLVSPDVQAMVTQLDPLMKKVLETERDFIIADLPIGPFLATGLAIEWPMVLQSTPTMLKVSIDVMFDLMSKMSSIEVQAMLSSHRASKNRFNPYTHYTFEQKATHGDSGDV